jgi:hypothetical protein
MSDTVRPAQETEHRVELYATPSESFTERYLGLSFTKFIIAFVTVVALSIYLGILLFGDNSLEVLLHLEEYENYLQHEIDTYLSENAALQKEYFELKELEPEK